MRDLIQKIKRIYFWVLCPVIVVSAAVVWFLGVGALTAQQKKNQQEIDGLYSTLANIRGKEKHPNSEVAAGMQALIQKRRDEVAKAWTEKYVQQTGEKSAILAWPKELGDDFIKEVKDLHPIEKKVAYPVDKNMELVLSLRVRYLEHIDKELPKLAKRIQAKWYMQNVDPNTGQPTESMNMESRRMGEYGQLGNEETLANQSVVEWLPNSQQEILQEHFRWQDVATMAGPGRRPEAASSYGSGTARPPKLLEILYAQEDLWVLQAVLDVIARTNDGAVGRYNAAVKEIEFIRMGKKAVPSSGHVERVAPPLPQGMDPAAMGSTGEVVPTTGPRGEPPLGEPAMGMEGEFMGEGMGPGMSAPDPAEGRYVDKDYQPLSAEKLRQVMKEPGAVDPAEAYLAVAKRIPVRMRIKIDQTKLEKFLVECANSPLTIEVRQLRVNPPDDGGLGMLDMPGSFGGEGEGRRRPMEGQMRREYGPPPGFPVAPGGQPGMPMTTADAIDAQSRTDVNVEIYGIVYFYNPVDTTLLGQTPAADAAASAAAAPGEPLASSP